MCFFSFILRKRTIMGVRNATLADAGHDTRAIQDWFGLRLIQHTALHCRGGLKAFGADCHLMVIES